MEYRLFVLCGENGFCGRGIMNTDIISVSAWLPLNTFSEPVNHFQDRRY